MISTKKKMKARTVWGTVESEMPLPLVLNTKPLVETSEEEVPEKKRHK